MVSARTLSVPSIILASVLPGLAQTANSLLDNTNPPVVTPAPPRSEPLALTPERRGDIYMARKMYREAIESYREAGMEKNAVLWNKVGIGFHQMQEFAQAKKHYERAIKINPKYSEAINNLGTIYYANKSYRKAVGLYRRALKVAPNSASIYSNLGTAHFARKKYKDASEAYQKALELDPEVFEHRGSYGVMLQERSVQERAKFHFYLAKTYAKAGVYDRALQYLRKALEEGYKERKQIEEAPEFEPLKENPEFQQLLAMEPRVL